LSLALLKSEVAHLNKLSVLFSTLLKDILLSIIDEFRLDLVHDAHKECRLSAKLRMTDDLKDFFSQVSPLGLIILNLIELEHPLKELVSNLVIRVSAFEDLDFEVNQSVFLALNDFEEKVRHLVFRVLELREFPVDILHSVSRIENVEVFLAFVSRSGEENTLLVDVLLETSSDVRLT